jgi:hypothetical protein
MTKPVVLQTLQQFLGSVAPRDRVRRPRGEIVG